MKRKAPVAFRPSREMSTLTLMFVGASFLFGILTALVANGLTDDFDTAALLWINQHASAYFDAFFLAVTQLGGVLFVASFSIFLALFLSYKKHSLRAIFVVVSIGGAALLGTMFKAVFERSRPDLWEWIIHETSFSFPSGHATASMAIALIVAALLWHTKWRLTVCIGGVIYVLLVGLSRLYLGVHYPTDILGGWLLSLGWVSLIAAACLFAASGRTKVKMESR